MAEIKIENLTFGYDGACENVFENASFAFDTNWRIGLIGRNGRGKTTLLKLLLGELEFRGKIIGNVCFDYFPCKIENKERMGIDILTENFPECEVWEVLKNLHQLDMEEECLYQPFNTLSNGQQTKILLAIMFSKEGKFLLIDEPTNNLDEQSRKVVGKFLERQKGFVLVSHDREFIDMCVNHVISINRNNIEVQSGNFSSWWKNKQSQDEFEKEQNEKLKKDITRLQESARRTQVWSDKVEKTKIGTRVAGLKPDRGAIGHKAAKMAKRAKSIENRQNKAIEEKSKLLHNLERQEELFLSNVEFIGNSVLEIQSLSISYGEKIVVNDISFKIEVGDKVAIIGKNGSGKTSLLKLILGEKLEYCGNIIKNSKLKISYVSQNYDWLRGSLRDFAKENNIEIDKFFMMLSKLGLERELFEKDIQTYSAGQKKKVLLAKSLCEEANLYVWDEPLNYIDVISRMQIENLLKESDATMIFVEHDSAFVKNLATKIVHL